MRKTMVLFAVSGLLGINPAAMAAEFDGETELVFGEPGQVTFDATELKTVFPAPEKPLEFDTWHDFYAFSEEHLNAAPLMREGSQIGIELAFEMIGQGYIPDEKTETLFAVGNPVTAFLSGKAGYIIVGGQQFCLAEDDCEAGAGLAAMMATPMALFDEIDTQVACDGEQENCAEFQSVNLHRSWRHIARGSTTQTRGGYQANSRFCWRFGFIPWACSEPTGEHELESRVRLCDGTGLAIFDRPLWGQNEPRVQFGFAAYFFGFEPAERLVGTWSSHESRGTTFTLDGVTSAGTQWCAPF
ncbi:MAG: hypothetical protein P1V51_15300 [Deltaproteobacteria bacterium]|nr:hypothetical protein [Deltaproteobacteria bacterium]